MSFSKITKIILATIIVFGGFALFYFFQNGSDEDMISLGEFSLPESFFVDDETEIKFEWTDDNTGEDLIIQSDKKSYFGINKSEIYFSVSNLNKDAQNFNLRFLFGEESAKLEKIEKINSGGATSELSLSENTFVKFDSMDGFRSSLYVRDTIQTGHTNYYKAVIGYNPNTKGEFYIEAKGDPVDSAQGGQGAYGLLDPWYNSTGLVGYWSFDGDDMDWGTNTAIDDSGNGNTGTITNMSTTSSPTIGVNGQALRFDGSDDYSNIPDSSSMRIGGGSFSLAFWVNPNSIQLDSADMIGTESYISNSIGWALRYVGSNNWSLYTYNGSVQLNTGGFSILPDAWSHVVIIHDFDNEIRIYKDGTLVKTKDIVGNGSIEKNYGLGIGFTDQLSRIFTGSFDEVAIFNRALSPDEISSLYRLGNRKAQVNTSNVNRLTSGLVGHWTFDGADMDWSTNTAIDRSGQGNDGSIIDMSATSSPSIGKVGQGLVFDGIDDRLNVAHDSSLNTGNTISINFWLKPPTAGWGSGATNNVILTKGTPASFWNGGASTGFTVGIDRTVNQILVSLDGVASLTHSPSSLTANEWNHIVVTYNNTTLRIYINDNLDEEIDLSAVNLDTTQSIHIGDYSSQRFLQGSLDEFRIYNRALSQDEVTELYNMGAKKLKANTTNVDRLTSGLVGHWTFDGADMDWSATTAEAIDRSGQGNHGDAINMDSSNAVIGKVGQALDFDGVSDYIRVVDPVNGSLDVVGGADLTVTAWIKSTDKDVVQQVILEKKNGSITSTASKGYALYWIDSGLARFLVYDTVNNYSSTYVKDVADGEWHFIVGVLDGDVSLITYVDGQPGNPTSITSLDSIENDYYFNINTANSSWRTDTIIDEVRAYNRALSEDEITELYNMGARKFKIN